MGPGQIYRDEKGNPLLWVREEEREGMHCNVLAGVRSRTIITRAVPVNTEVPELTLVHDTVGRHEAEVERLVALQVERENEVLRECMKEAAKKLPASEAELLRALYVKRMAP